MIVPQIASYFCRYIGSRESDRSRSSLKFPPRPKREKKEEKEIVQTKKIERKLEAYYIAAFEREVEEEESAQD